ncbi:hypothetical protein KI387_042588, partial [Taxus chinensis]
MPKLAPEPEVLPVKITTHAKVACAREVLQQKPTITKEDVLHARYLDPAHQKEVYQETMEVLRNLQGEIQCLKEQSRKMEQKKATETVQSDIDDLKE